jgi:hypothetical protein
VLGVCIGSGQQSLRPWHLLTRTRENPYQHPDNLASVHSRARHMYYPRGSEYLTNLRRYRTAALKEPFFTVSQPYGMVKPLNYNKMTRPAGTNSLATAKICRPHHLLTMQHRCSLLEGHKKILTSNSVVTCGLLPPNRQRWSQRPC